MRLGLAVAVAVVLAPLPAGADRLRLAGGGTIETSAWWIEGERLVYESGAGTVSLPRAMVLAIDPTDPGAARTVRAPAPAPAPAPATPKRPAARSPEAAALAEAGAALGRGDLETAAGRFCAVVEADPAHVGTRIACAAGRLALGQDAHALGIVLDGLARTPGEPGLLELRGDLHDRDERVEDALRAWREAFAGAPSDRLRDKILRGERELTAGGDYALATTPHFNLRFDGEVDDALAGAVNALLEEQYWELSARFDHLPPQPITVLLYPRQQFREVTQTPEWVGGLYDGKIRVPLGGISRLDPRARRVLIHELTHAVVHSKTRGRCPRWLHEGLAQLAEGRSVRPAEHEEVVARADRRDPWDWERDGFSYPVALSLTQFLEDRGGPDRVVTLLERLGDGLSLDAALVELYGEDHRALCTRWRDRVLAEPAGSVPR